MVEIRAVDLPGRFSLQHPPKHPPRSRPPNEQSKYGTAAPAPVRNDIAQGHQLQCKEKVRNWWPLARPAGCPLVQGAVPQVHTGLFQLTVRICHCTPQTNHKPQLHKSCMKHIVMSAFTSTRCKWHIIKGDEGLHVVSKGYGCNWSQG